MKNRSFMIFATMIFFFGLCISIAEAGPGASKAYRVSVTMPVTAENSMKQQKNTLSKQKEMQIKKTSAMRENQLVSLKTVTSR